LTGVQNREFEDSVTPMLRAHPRSVDRLVRRIGQTLVPRGPQTEYQTPF
jgi:hypothetical protein